MDELNKEKKEKDPNNKIKGWDLLDMPSLFRKLPVGPSVEELQKSKVDQLMNNKSRPTSHTVKDVLAFTLGNAAQEAAGAAVGAGINKIKGSKAISKRIDDLLNTAKDSAKKSRAMDLAGRKSDDVAQGYIKEIDDAYDASRKADNAVKNAGKNKATLQAKHSDLVKDIDSNKSIIEQNKKLIESLKRDYNLDDIDWKELDLDKNSVSNLPSEDRTRVAKSVEKFNAETTNASLTKKVAADEKKAAKLLEKINNFPSDAQLSEEAEEAKNFIKSHKGMLEDYYEGMSKEDIAKKYGKETQTYVDSAWNRNAKTAGPRVWKLGDEDEIFYNWLAIFGDDPRSAEFLMDLTKETDEELVDKFIMATEDLFKNITPDNPVETIKENGNRLMDDWFTIKKFKSEQAAHRTAFASDIESFNRKREATDRANDALTDVARNKGKQLLGSDIFGIKLKEPAARKQILDKLKKEKSYIDTFDKLIDPKDPIASAAMGKRNRQYMQELEPLLKQGMSLSDAIQDKALQRVIDYYDNDFDNYIRAILDQDVPPSTLEGMGLKPDLSKSKIRNPDGTLKDAEELAEFLTKDPIYIDTINDFVKGLTDNARAYTIAGGLEGATVPLLARYLDRELKNHLSNNTFDPLGKDPGIELPPNMRPWDSSTEFSTADKLWDNTKNLFGVNFDLDPSRYSRKQLDDLKQALILANDKAKIWNTSQVKNWSDREVLRLIKEIGNGKRPEIANDVRNIYAQLEEDE